MQILQKNEIKEIVVDIMRKNQERDPASSFPVTIQSYDLYVFKSGISFFCINLKHNGLKDIAELSYRSNILCSQFHRIYANECNESREITEETRFQYTLQNLFLDAMNTCINLPLSLDEFFFFQKGKADNANAKVHFHNFCFDLKNEDDFTIDKKLFYLSKSSIRGTTYLPVFSKDITREQYDNNRIFGISSEGFGVLCKEETNPDAKIAEESRTHYRNGIKDNYFFFYLIALHQRFLILMHLNELNHIDISKYNVDKLNDLLKSLSSVKATYFYKSISPNYFHQDFYKEVYNKLEIDLFMNEFNDETTSLRNHQEAIYQRKTKNVLSIITFFSSLSVINVVYNLLADFFEISNELKIWKAGILFLVTIIHIWNYFTSRKI